MTKTTSIFVPGVGQQDNIGDIVLRRTLIDWLRPHGDLHVYLGRHSDDYVDALRLNADDVVHRSFVGWYRSALAAGRARNGAYFFKPGEIQLSLPGLKEHLVMLPLQLIYKVNSLPVSRIGSGSRNFSPLPRALMRPSIALSRPVVWRDAATATYFGTGRSAPDLAYWRPGAPRLEAERAHLVVSMRGDRPEPSDVWVQAVRDVASSLDLSIVCATQVARDSEPNALLARRLGADHIAWNGQNHLEQEAKLRDLYATSAVAISDRLHVLIVAASEGAAPVAPLTIATTKVQRHFDEIGLRVAFETGDASAGEIRDEILGKIVSKDRLASALVDGHTKLEAVRNELDALLGFGNGRQ